MSTAHSAVEEKDRLLVIPLKDKGGVSQDEASLLTNILSTEIYRSGKFTILNRDDMKAVLDEKEFELAMGCDDDNNICLLENVAKLAVNKIIAGDVGKLGRKYIVSIRMINEDGENEIMERESCVCEIEELDKTMEQISYKLLKYLAGDVERNGAIRVESEPSAAKIYIDGAYSGTTPETIQYVLPGSRELVLKLEGHEDLSKRVDVKAGEEETILVNLEENKPQAYTDSGAGVEFVLVKGGCFEMGDTFGDGGDDEKPIHEVCMGDFYIGKYEVTQGQWEDIMGNNPSDFKKGLNFPVEQVSWDDVQRFIINLNRKTGKNYRLPTEAEWEYAARSGGKREKFAGTNSEFELRRYAWYDSNSGRRSHPVGRKNPNELGLYDMTGNVWERVQDIYNKDAYRKHQSNNPMYTESGPCRVERGGSWNSVKESVRASGRRYNAPNGRHGCVGFRLARTP
jgi:formylglycine-generating enzyme required for sulfatase activity